MKVRAGLGTFAAAAFAALALAGDGAKTYDIDWHERWTAKQVVTYTVHETSDMDMSMAGNSMKAEHEVVDAVYVVRCDEVDEKGDPTKRTVFVKSWKKTKDGTPDESLAGELVTTAGKEWKLASGKAAGAAAKKWLDSTFGKKDSGDPLEKIAPKKLTVGEPWKADPKAAADAFGKAMEDAPFDASRVTMELTLVSAEGTPPDASGKCTFKVHLPIGNLPNLPPQAKLHEGSGVEVTGTRSGPLTKSMMIQTVHMDMDLKMDIDVPTPNGTITTSTTGKMTKDSASVAGGEIPEPKAPSPPPSGGK
jgi:hypothetical protein